MATNVRGLTHSQAHGRHIAPRHTGKLLVRPIQPCKRVAFGAVRSSVEPKEVAETASSNNANGGPSPEEIMNVPLSELMPPGTTEENKNRVARYSGRKLAKRKIKELEGQRPLSDYMALPVSQYSVLDAARIERLDENIFKCYVGSFKMFRMRVEPIVTVKVVTNEKGCTINLLDCELDGSDAVKAVNGVFTTRMTNTVSWEQLEDSKRLTSNAVIEVSGLTPKYMNIVPIRVIERVGNTVMQQILNISVPQFLKQLEKDYQNWAKGDDSRGAVGTGEWKELDSSSVSAKKEGWEEEEKMKDQ